jgi:hypothetical protein
MRALKVSSDQMRIELRFQWGDLEDTSKSPGIHQGGTGQEGAEDQRRFPAGSYFDRNCSQFKLTIHGNPASGIPIAKYNIVVLVLLNFRRPSKVFQLRTKREEPVVPGEK